MTNPVRLQLSRKKGFNLQALSLATNGLPAVNVARPSILGNPFVVGVDGDAPTCVVLYRNRAVEWIERCQKPGFEGWFIEHRRAIEAARGHNVACWCDLGECCHGDIVLEIANR